MSTKQADVIAINERSGPEVSDARVVSVKGGEVTVRQLGVTRKARVAFSCLVRPAPGDLVLCQETGAGINYILGIVERPGTQDMTLDFPADATLRTDQGSLGVFSGRSVTFVAGDKLNCLSDQAIHKSRQAVVAFDDLTASGSELQASFKTVRLVSRVIHTMAGLLLKKVKSYIRQSEDLDRVSAGQMTRKVDGLYAMDSRYTVMVSKKDTKIDGERIHMG
jgi:Protein of unknown function (DUF3540)